LKKKDSSKTKKRKFSETNDDGDNENKDIISQPNKKYKQDTSEIPDCDKKELENIPEQCDNDNHDDDKKLKKTIHS